MVKRKTFQKPKKPTKAMSKFMDCCEWSPAKEILDPSSLAKAVAECLLNNDPEGVVEVIEIYLETTNVANGC